jgi:hypothetical protein
MVAVVSGNGLGLAESSALLLGGRGLWGDPSVGRAREQVYVNAATGNLVIRNRDEILVGRGPDATLARTYNSLGRLDDDNGDNWLASVARRVLSASSSRTWARPGAARAVAQAYTVTRLATHSRPASTSTART